MKQNEQKTNLNTSLKTSFIMSSFYIFLFDKVALLIVLK